MSSSWFANSTLTSTLSTLATKVQSTVSDPLLLQKLTLQSPELLDERTKIIAEQNRKEAVKDSLSELLPWETRDVEMEILVDECKEVILALSEKEETFTGPFVLPGGFKNDTTAEDEEEDEELRQARDVHEAEKSSEKLSKLQPLPTILAEFDIDTHVGLIQRLLEIDEKLVQVHSRLSSGGARECAFWQNYFFHCAYARYEAGLSIDEIWSNDHCRGDKFVGERGEKEEEEEFDIVNGQEEEEEEEVIFDELDGVQSNKVEVKSSPSTSAAPTKQSSASVVAAAAIADLVDDLENVDPADLSGGTSATYDFVPEVSGDDGEMDELEAEIAAALGD
ncbi:hypothetical protein ACHAWO_002022 [Cyclotella atomus]|uniref:BSD domain-containing protein n=1 Tax=Cyclotella atomus TaxID=382360 RepID=A0ABD3PP53_9STRA